jgi:hypothetical protein
MLKTSLKTDNIKIFDADLRFRTLLIINLAERKVELPAFVFEFEKFDEEDKESIQDTIQAATMQMRENDYAAVLKQEGHTNIHLIAIAFKGKEVRMKYEEA